METSSAPVPCDVLIHGGIVLTLDVDDRVFGDGIIAIAGDRIVAVGATAELDPRFVAGRRIDARGRIVMPGLVNTHNHTPLMIARGMVEDLGFAPAYTPRIPQGQALSGEEAYLLARLGAWELLRFGSTTVVDYYRHPESCARALAEAGLRAFVGGRIHDADPVALARGEWRHDAAIGAATLAENVELIERWDGHDGGRIRCSLAPHAPDTCSRALLRQVASLATREPQPVHTHLAQSEGEVTQVLEREGRRPVEVLDEVGLLGPRLIAAHCIWLEPDDIARLGRTTTRVAHVPVGNAASGTIAPVVALEQAGATITLATDTKSGDMFETMRAALAVARIRGAGYTLTARDALRWATANGAAALGLAGAVGSLAAGMKADVLLLDAGAPNLRPIIDGVGVVVHAGTGANVHTVLVDGRVVLEAGCPTRFDGDEVVAAAQAVASRLWRHHGWVPVIDDGR
ncbi:MAG: amidohydrolase family protein [Candidatus Rokuibacteriota bacterium]